jgi:hypothetical protein
MNIIVPEPCNTHNLYCKEIIVSELNEIKIYLSVILPDSIYLKLKFEVSDIENQYVGGKCTIDFRNTK